MSPNYSPNCFFLQIPILPFPSIISIYLKAIGGDPYSTKVYLAGQTVEKRFNWCINSISTPITKYSITSAYISFYENSQSDKSLFEINLIEGQLNWKDLTYSGLSFYSTTNASICRLNTSFPIEKEDE